LAPDLLLLDEPLSALDEKIRREMQIELKRIQQQTATTFVYVTHDQDEALTMSDRIAVIERGRCVQCDTPRRLFERPRNRFVAEFFRGCNVLDVETANGRLSLAGTSLPAGLAAAGGAQALAVRGEAVRLGATDGDLTLQAGLEAVTYRGLYYDYRLRLDDGQTLSAITTESRDADIGAIMPIALDTADLVLLEPD
jgi:ABC-type Fe3+/spermidine/putrescine transport system ATPase subunit